MKNIKLTKSIIHKMDKYLKGELNEQKTHLFEKELENTPSLQQAFINYKIADDAIELMIGEKVRALLS